MAARFHMGVRLGGLGERKDRVDDRPHGAALDQRPDMAAQLAGETSLLGDGSPPQSRAGEQQLLLLEEAEIEGDLAAGGAAIRAGASVTSSTSASVGPTSAP